MNHAKYAIVILDIGIYLLIFVLLIEMQYKVYCL